MLFYRTLTDGSKLDSTPAIKDSMLGASAILIGAGPSLHDLSPSEAYELSNLPILKFAVNSGGMGRDGDGWLLKPTYWTTFDPTERFSSLVMRDPSITKFVTGARATDPIPDTSNSLCTGPGVYCFNNEYRGYDNFLSHASEKIVHAQDSMLQALDIMFQMGIRHVYCLGCEMKMIPSHEQVCYGQEVGVNYDTLVKSYSDAKQAYTKRTDLLSEFVKQLMDKTKQTMKEVHAHLESLTREGQYAMSEQKGFAAAVKSDMHYWQRVQTLRLSRPCFERYGFKLTSVSNNSRLNDYFPHCSVQDLISDVDLSMGTYQDEITLGRYTGQAERLELPYAEDLKPSGFNPAMVKNEPVDTPQGLTIADTPVVNKNIQDFVRKNR